MPFIIKHHQVVHPHQWSIAEASCNLDDENDLLVNSTVDLIRRSYGEDAVVKDAETLLAVEIENRIFSVEHLKQAIREGLPDPAKEGKKPIHLTNYRSQSAEMVAKNALSKVYHYQYPAAPQEGSANPNQPILGFDGWGILKKGNEPVALVLIQVKATDSKSSPPPDACRLAGECRQAPSDKSAICRALTMLSRLLNGEPLQIEIIRMLEQIGQGKPIPLFISPAVVRGSTIAIKEDLEPVMSMANEILPAKINAVAVSIGVSLNRFGELVMAKAREAA